MRSDVEELRQYAEGSCWLDKEAGSLLKLWDAHSDCFLLVRSTAEGVVIRRLLEQKDAFRCQEYDGSRKGGGTEIMFELR